jgi:alanine-glyoxylate transaminase/serine-glyoxylate transaminase/serine-pyruvate transaminase
MILFIFNLITQRSFIMSHQNPVFIPGPTNIPDKIRRAMDQASWDHRAPDFAAFFHPILNGLKTVFKTTAGEVLIFPASGTGGLEASIVNTLSPGDKVLAASYGMFSQRWIEICQRFEIEIEVIDVEWGEAAPVAQFAQVLANDSDHDIKAVLVTQNETATGVETDIASVREAMNQSNHPALLCVDGVSSIASVDFRMDEWGVDLAVAGSQKGFMLNTGLALVGVSQKALAAGKQARLPRCYFDFADMIAANKVGSFPFTAPVSLIYGLRESIRLLQEEGLDNVFDRHRRIAQGVRQAVESWGLTLCGRKPEQYSQTVSAIYVPDGFNSSTLVELAYNKHGVSYGLGLGKMAGRVFRIGHVGMMTDAMALSGIATIEMAMKDLDYPIELGSGVAAAQEFYRKSA